MKFPTLSAKNGDALLVVDVQNDFCPGGALPVPEGHAVVPVLNDWIDLARRAGIVVYTARDWHPLGHISFRESGGDWPPHCLQDSWGAAFHPDLRLPDNMVKIIKGCRFDKDQYSVFNETGLAVRLRRDGVRRLWIGGLAEDYCVVESVVDGCRAGFEFSVILPATRPITPESGKAARARMQEAGATLYDE